MKKKIKPVEKAKKKMKNTNQVLVFILRSIRSMIFVFISISIVNLIYNWADFTIHINTLNNIPLGRFAQLSDVATAVAYLASDSSSMITGTSILVDGGWTAI